METSLCEICGGQSLQTLFPVSDLRLQTTEKMYNLQRCQLCDHVSLIPRPEEHELGTFYPERFYASGKADFLTRLNYKTALGHIHRIAKNGRLLDIGCGTGAFLTAAAEYGYEIYGQELSPEGSKIAVEKHGERISCGDLSKCEFKTDFFDIITLWHVAEHVYDIAHFMKEIQRILKPGGTLVLEVPNFNCPEINIFHGYSESVDAPRHLRHFSKTSLRMALESAGFNCKINNGWSFLVSPLSILHSGKNFMRAKAGNKKTSIFEATALIPLLILSCFNCIYSLISQNKSIIGAKCTKPTAG